MNCYFSESVFDDFESKLIVDIVLYFQSWNKKEHTFIIDRVISCHMSECILRHNVFTE